MKIEIFYFEGCPNYRPAADLVRSIIQEEAVSAEITEIEVPNEQAAARFTFLGSPTIRVSGLDIDPAMREAKGGNLACRCYPGGVPSTGMIRAAIKEAQRQEV
jgi:hypothetical protein